MPKHTGHSTDDILTKLTRIETNLLKNGSDPAGSSDECDDNGADGTSWSEDGTDKGIPDNGGGIVKAGSDDPAAGSSKGRCVETQSSRPQRCRDTRFRVIRGAASSSCPKNTVSLHKIVKYTNRLMFSLNELNAESVRVRVTCEQRGAVDELINQVKWFLKDLEQSRESCDQLTVLLNTYDTYRTEYYKLRDRINGGGADRKVRRYRGCPSKGTASPCARDRASGEDSCATAEAVDSYVVVTLGRDDDPDCKEPAAGKELDERPGLLDVTKVKPADCAAAAKCPSKAAERSPNWSSYLYECYCFCFPCKCFAYCWWD